MAAALSGSARLLAPLQAPVHSAWPCRSSCALRASPACDGAATCALSSHGVAAEGGGRCRRRCSSAARIAAAAGVADPVTFEFLDEGDCLEVRVPLGCESSALNTKQVAVNAYADSLLVTLTTEDGLVPLLVASPLYARVNPSDTVWFLDDDEVVINLRKANRELQWPELIEATSALAKGVSNMLKSCSINVVGGSSDANWGLAQELASLLNYVPMSTQQLIETAIGKTTTALEDEEGEAGLAEAEAAVLEGLTSNVRCVVATLGGRTAGARAGAARWLHAAVTVWLEEAGPAPAAQNGEEGASNQGGRFSWADVHVRAESPAGEWEAGNFRRTAHSSLKAIKELLEDDVKLTGKKGLYLRLGCRGDWPDIMPPGWAPASAQLKGLFG